MKTQPEDILCANTPGRKTTGKGLASQQIPGTANDAVGVSGQRLHGWHWWRQRHWHWCRQAATNTCPSSTTAMEVNTAPRAK